MTDVRAILLPPVILMSASEEESLLRSFTYVQDDRCWCRMVGVTKKEEQTNKKIACGEPKARI